jgi:dihydroorotase-like cyclic amidohydrolase
MSLPALARIMAENPARAFGLYPTKGVIQVGSDADLTVIDPNRRLTLGAHRYQSGADFSIWEGKQVAGAPVMTFLHGQLVMKDGEIVGAAPMGRRIAAGTFGVFERPAQIPSRA